MQVDRATLEERFRDMSDEELLRRLRDGELTELAVEVARAEAGRRGLALAEDAGLDDALAMDAPLAHGPLKLCARYLNPMNAQVLAARLESEGLAPCVFDADTVYAYGALFGSLPRGGVRVMVPESQLEDAKRIRAAFDAGEYAIDEDFDVDR